MLCVCCLWSMLSSGQLAEFGGTINGISIWSDPVPRSSEDYHFVASTNANWISLQSYGVVKSKRAEVLFDLDSTWECSSFEGLKKNIGIAKDQGYKIFLKPHLTLEYGGWGVWVGNMRRGKDENWKVLEASYMKYLLNLARIADSCGVEMMSLGTELGTFPQKRQVFWQSLIDTVRTVYTGKLTYCANFDAYKKYPFWDQMDFIGVDAYFTVNTKKNTSYEGCMQRWGAIRTKLKAFSDRFNKPLFFGEFGYMNIDHAALWPWRNERDRGAVNDQAQANAYQALLDSFWGESWFIGGFSWLWRFESGATCPNPDYTPQNKPAERIISTYYQKYR